MGVPSLTRSLVQTCAMPYMVTIANQIPIDTIACIAAPRDLLRIKILVTPSVSPHRSILVQNHVACSYGIVRRRRSPRRSSPLRSDVNKYSWRPRKRWGCTLSRSRRFSTGPIPPGCRQFLSELENGGPSSDNRPDKCTPVEATFRVSPYPFLSPILPSEESGESGAAVVGSDDDIPSHRLWPLLAKAGATVKRTNGYHGPNSTKWICGSVRYTQQCPTDSAPAFDRLRCMFATNPPPPS